MILSCLSLAVSVLALALAVTDPLAKAVFAPKRKSVPKSVWDDKHGYVVKP